MPVASRVLDVVAVGEILAAPAPFQAAFSPVPSLSAPSATQEVYF
jgi:hypothetical protein